MKFSELDLNQNLKKTLSLLDYDEMFKIQEEAWKVLNDKKDCIIQSKTGSGKTIAYALPILQNLDINQKDPQAIILCPTRELARQVKSVFDQLGSLSSLKTVLLIGKESYELQKQDLHQRVHVLIGTPGRIVEHLKEGNIQVKNISYLVLDEADEMLNQDFEEDMKIIYKQLMNPTTCLVSATLSSSMKQFVKNPERICTEIKNEQIQEWAYKSDDKWNLLLQVLIEMVPLSCLIFVSTQQGVDDLYQQLKDKKISVEKIHGGMDQEYRFQSMEAFKMGKVRILVATDVASRGIDIQKVDLIINYDLPKSKINYTHRIGRSGRALEIGCAISFYTEEQEDYFNRLDIQTKDFTFTKSMDDISFLETSTKVVEDKSLKLKEEVTTLFINAGKDKKIRPGDIVGALCQIESVTIEDIGAIKIESHQSFIDIYHHKEEIILKNLKKIKSKNVRIERARRK